jgi:hypothetical protein
LLLPGLLFTSLFALFLLLVIPGERASLALVTYDSLKRGMERRFISDADRPRLEILGRKAMDVVKSGVLIGICAGLLGFLLTLHKLRWLAPLFGVALFFAGLALARYSVNYEFKKWQARVFDDLPDLIGFAPAFLKTGGITLRGAISMTLPFLSGPLRYEMWIALDKINRTGNARGAFDDLAKRVGHPCMDSVCLRMSTSWDASPSPELFDDLTDQIRDVEEIAAARSTAGKAAMLALICVLGLLGALMVYGYPAFVFMGEKLMAGFGL